MALELRLKNNSKFEGSGFCSSGRGLVHKLCLGTAQFGEAYGIANKSGQLDSSQVKAMLQLADRSGIRILDTARIYGKSESIIGDSQVAQKFRIITKTVPIQENVITKKNIQVVRDAFAKSLKSLKVDSVAGLLVHNANDLLSQGGGRFGIFFRNSRMKGESGSLAFRFILQ